MGTRWPREGPHRVRRRDPRAGDAGYRTRSARSRGGTSRVRGRAGGPIDRPPRGARRPSGSRRPPGDAKARRSLGLRPGRRRWPRRAASASGRGRRATAAPEAPPRRPPRFLRRLGCTPNRSRAGRRRSRSRLPAGPRPGPVGRSVPASSRAFGRRRGSALSLRLAPDAIDGADRCRLSTRVPAHPVREPLRSDAAAARASAYDPNSEGLSALAATGAAGAGRRPSRPHPFPPAWRRPTRRVRRR